MPFLILGCIFLFVQFSSGSLKLCISFNLHLTVLPGLVAIGFGLITSVIMFFCLGILLIHFVFAERYFLHNGTNK